MNLLIHFYNMNDVDLSPENILEKIKEVQQQLESLLSNNNSTKTRVLLLGPTGVGKTTFMHLLAQCNISSSYIASNPNLVLQCNEGQCKLPNFIIGHTGEAETTLPGLREESNVLLCDCPGLLDNRSINQRILNSISIDALLTQPCKIKILLVLTQSHFEVDRGKSALEIMDEAGRFLTDYKQLESCVGLVVTKVMPGTSIERCLKYVNVPGLERPPLLNFFIKHPERCFKVIRPLSEGPYENFEDRDQILSFIQSGEVENPEHRILIDESTLEKLCNSCNRMNEKLNESLRSFTNVLSEKYSNCTTVSELNDWLSKITLLRVNASQGIQQFYQLLSQLSEFESSKNELSPFVFWNRFFNDVIRNSSSFSASNEYMFNCRDFIQELDNKIESLRYRRNVAENRIQEARDQNIISIVQNIETIVKQGGVMPDHSFRPFDVLIEHPMHYYTEAANFDPINFEQISMNDSCLIGKLTHEEVGYLMKQMETVLRDVINYFELTKNDAVCQQILARMRDTDEDPDNFEEFKYVTDTFGNKALSVFEGFLHPINFVTSFPVVIGVSMKGLFKKKRDIVNVERMHHWFSDGTHSRRIGMYKCVGPMLRIYGKFAKLYQQDCSVKFTYGNIKYFGFYFYDVEPIRPNESLQYLISQCRSMTNIINAANNRNSFEVFNGIFSLYNQVCGEIEQRKMEDLGSNILDSIISGDHVDNILTSLTDDLNVQQKNQDQIALYSEVVATTRLMRAIYGRGIGSHERKDLFGIMTIVNCQNTDGLIRVYSRQNVQDINSIIVTRVRDLIYETENSNDQNLGDFSPENFVQTSRSYISKINREYEQAQNDLIDSIQDLFNALLSISKNSTNNLSRTSSTGDSSQQSDKLLDDLQKVEGVQIENEQDNKANVSINGSIIQVAIKKLIKISPQIIQASKCTAKLLSLRSKSNQINNFKPLISFFERTSTALSNNKMQGIILDISNNRITSLEPIIFK